MTTIEAESSDSTALQIISDDASPPALASPGRTLLPGPLASLVSTFAGVTSLSLRVGSKVGGFAIAGTREMTLTSLELTRAALEAVLTMAGRDVSQRRHGELGRAEAESILERSISALHSSIATASFFASSGFYFSAATLNSASSLSIQGLSTLNAILGSTESSRAVAAIITLIRNELNRPGFGDNGEPVGYLDLFIGTISFVLLQRWGRRKTELEFREKGGEEVIWDTVIDDKGFRADVVGTKKGGYFDITPNPGPGIHSGRPVSFVSPAGDEEIEAFERGTVHETTDILLTPEAQTNLSDEEIRAHIMSQLPDGARAVITSETITAKTIKVDIYDTPMTDISAPPGTIMIAERLPQPESTDLNGQPRQTIVFRTALQRSSSADIEPAKRLHLTGTDQAHPESQDVDDVLVIGRSSKTTGDPPTRPLTSSPKLSDENRRQVPTINQGMHQPRPPHSTVPSPVNNLIAPVANQKKSRRPVDTDPDQASGAKGTFGKSSRNRLTSKNRAGTVRSEKSGGPLKKALKSLSPNQSSAAVKDLPRKLERPASREIPTTTTSNATQPSAIPRLTTTIPSGELSLRLQIPQTPKRPHTPLPTGKSLPPRPTSRQNFYSVHEKRRDSLVSETYSTHSIESRPGSPTVARRHTRSTSGLTKTKSEVDVGVWDDRQHPPTPKHHKRSKSFVPSLYSVATKGSDDALILAAKVQIRQNSVFDDSGTLLALHRDGKIPGMFPDQHMVCNVRRFARFASASYGSHFLRVMGLTSEDNLRSSKAMEALNIHHEHDSFSKHTGLPPHAIVLSSYADPPGVGGVTVSSTSKISPLVHFISVDHDSRAVVLTCRGTLGFEDVLTDMLCNYDELYWQGQPFQVHRGIHASARRLLAGSSSSVIRGLKHALEDNPDYGLVLTGHSLGGAVASVLAILLSEPSSVEIAGALFVTAAAPKLLSHPDYLPSNKSSNEMLAPVTLPVGRPIHVYAYGTPATLSPGLRLATRGLITTIVNSADIVPSLSLGVLHDFRSVALNLKTDTTGAISALKTRVSQRIRHAVQSAFYVNTGPPPPENTAGDGIGEDTWAWAALKTLRAGMTAHKLVPPGEVFVVETTRVFDRQSFTSGTAAVPETATERVFRSLGRPAMRVQLKLIRNVEARFGELRFGSSMFSDHSPGRYEASLAALEKGILEV